MALTTSWCHTDTALATEPTVLQPDSLNFSSDFSKKESKADNAVLVNTTSPLDRQETVKFSWSRIGNVYSGTGIDQSSYSPNKTGVSALMQLNTILSVTDSVTGKRTDLPISAHVVLKVPNHEVITSAILTQVATRLVSLMYEQSGTDAGTRLNSLVRGACLPKALA